MSSFAQKYGPWALVTGASAGIGRALALELAARGLNIVAVARRASLLDALKKEIEKRDGVGIEVRVLPVDLVEQGAIEAIDRATQDLDVGLVAAVAGMATAGEFVAGTLEASAMMARLNVIVPTQLVHLMAGRMVNRKRKGGVLLLSSLFAYQGVPYFAQYAATKAYILLFGEALSFELGRHGIDVTVLSPGLTRTDMPAQLPLDFSKLPLTYQSASAVAETGVEALGRKASVVSGGVNKLFAWQNRLTPRSLPVTLFGYLIKRAFLPQKGASR